MAITVAEHLGMKDEKRWFEHELSGYAKGRRTAGPMMLGDVLGVAENSDIPERVARYRRVEGSFYIATSSNPARDMPYLHFFYQPIAEIEALLQQQSQSQGQFTVTIPWNSLPPIYSSGLTELLVAPQSVTVYFSPLQLAGILSGLRAELSRFFPTARLLVEANLPPPAPPIPVSTSTTTTGNITGQTITIVTASGSAKVEASSVSKTDTSSAIATLREEVAAIQDLIIGNRKEILEFERQQDDIKLTLNKIVNRIEERLANKPVVNNEELTNAAVEATKELVISKEVDPTMLKQISRHGITQSLVASVIFEGIQQAWPYIQAFAKTLGGP